MDKFKCAIAKYLENNPKRSELEALIAKLNLPDAELCDLLLIPVETSNNDKTIEKVKNNQKIKIQMPEETARESNNEIKKVNSQETLEQVYFVNYIDDEDDVDMELDELSDHDIHDQDVAKQDVGSIAPEKTNQKPASPVEEEPTLHEHQQEQIIKITDGATEMEREDGQVDDDISLQNLPKWPTEKMDIQSIVINETLRAKLERLKETLPKS